MGYFPAAVFAEQPEEPDALSFAGDQECDDQEECGDDENRVCAQSTEGDRAHKCAQEEDCDDGVVVERLPEFAGLVFPESMKERLAAAAEISGAHGGSEGESADSPESLDLHCTKEGDGGICHEIQSAVGNE